LKVQGQLFFVEADLMRARLSAFDPIADMRANHHSADAFRELVRYRESSLSSASTLNNEMETEYSELIRAGEVLARESADAERVSQTETFAVHHERQKATALLEEGAQLRRALESRLRSEIRRLQGTQAMACAADVSLQGVDDGTLAHIDNVVNETCRMMGDQGEHFERILTERIELRRRLLDTLTHLEGTEKALIATNSVSTAAPEEADTHRNLVAFQEATCRSHLNQLQKLAELQKQWASDAERAGATAPAGRASHRSSTSMQQLSAVSLPWQPPPTILEETTHM